MVDYRVRSISLLNLVNDIKNERLIPDAYFQRNLVWRDVHNKDFIKTILMGFPFPQIFISKGKVNVETMTTISCIVDGQQRTNAIKEFINNTFQVDDRYFSDLDDDAKSRFLKYEIAVIELDLENDDPRVQDIFQRINRTSNSLTTIEKMASEYSTSDFMLVAKLLSDQISLDQSPNDDFREDPNIPNEFFDWARNKSIQKFVQLISRKGVFTQRDIAKKAHLMHVLNIMSTLQVGFFNRNEKTLENLNDYATQFDDKDDVVDVLEQSAALILKLKLRTKSYWYNKSNIFSLIIAISNAIKDDINIDADSLKNKLLDFENNTPEDYKLAATEGVNSTSARSLRDGYIVNIISTATVA